MALKRWDPARETDPVDKTHDNSLPSDALWTIQPGTTILLSQLFFKGNFSVKTDNNNNTILRKNYDKVTDFLPYNVVAAVTRPEC